MSRQRIINALLGSGNDLKKTDAEQQYPESIKATTEGACTAWMACEDTSTRCIDGGMHQPCLKGVVNPLPDTDKHQTQTEQQSVCVGNTFDLDRHAHDSARCTKCHKEVVPVLNLEPGVRFVAHSDLPFDASIVSQGGPA